MSDQDATPEITKKALAAYIPEEPATPEDSDGED